MKRTVDPAMTTRPNPAEPATRHEPAARAEVDRAERRSFVWVAVALTAVIVVLTGSLVLVTEVWDPPTPQSGSAAQSQAPALDLPDGGHEPTSPGDRGGWEQLALLGLLCVVFGGGATYLVTSSRRARRSAIAATGASSTSAGDAARPATSVVEGVGEQREHGALDHGRGAGGREPPM